MGPPTRPRAVPRSGNAVPGAVTAVAAVAPVTVGAAVATSTRRRRTAARSPWQQVWDRVRPWLSRADAWGAVLIALGVLDALGTWLDKAGPHGRALDGAGEAAGGALALTIPVVLAGLGVALLRRPESVPRLAAAGVLAAATAAGLVHLIKDPGVDRRSAGGWLGATVGEPLRSLLGTGAAVLVLAVALVAALLVLTRTSPRQAFAGVRTGVGTAGAGVLATLHWLGLMAERPGGESDEEELEEDDPPPVDVADEELDEEEYEEEEDLEPVAEVEEPPAAPV